MFVCWIFSSVLIYLLVKMDKLIFLLFIIAMQRVGSSNTSTSNNDSPLSMQNFQQVPPMDSNSIRANLAYNSINFLSLYVFYTNGYRNVQTLHLGHNQISIVDGRAFKQLQQLKVLDLSYNNISTLEPKTFRTNHRLEKLEIAYNNVSFDIEKPFLHSTSLQTLLLSNNQIMHVFNITFARLPNLKVILLDENPLFFLAAHSFRQLKHLQYLSLAKTSVYRLTNSMFGMTPRLTDLTDTYVATLYEPPLRKLRSDQLKNFLNVNDSDSFRSKD